jgi:aldehyde dehydrogenase (NAD+)/succinate-semialdehyde dehydrogenase/glutarate-semialdehyde dehydrogenase
MAGETTTAAGPARVLQDALVRRLTQPVVSGGSTTTTYAPFTGAHLAELPTSTAADVAEAYDRARAARGTWAARDPRARAVPFLRFHDLVLDRQREVLDIVQWETGKARKHAFEEVIDAAAGTLYHARTAHGLLRPHRRGGALPVATRTVEVRQPKGTVAVVTPWNYPLSLTMADVVPALLAGNAVVHKPDTQTAMTALWARDLLVEAGMPAEVWQVVLGEPAEIGDALVDGADYVAFTGSTRGGRAVA